MGLRLGDTRVATYPDCAIFDSWRFDTTKVKGFVSPLCPGAVPPCSIPVL
jgi:hypothetical protein